MFARSHLFVKQNNIQWIQFLFYWRRSRRWVPSTSIVSLVVMEFRILCRKRKKILVSCLIKNYWWRICRLGTISVWLMFFSVESWMISILVCVYTSVHTVWGTCHEQWGITTSIHIYIHCHRYQFSYVWWLMFYLFMLPNRKTKWCICEQG